MLVGRDHEYAYFEEYMKRPGSQLVVFYGQKFLGKTAFLLDFCKDRPFSYCLARSGCEEWMLKDLENATRELKALSDMDKKVLIIDEFQNISKTEQFMPFCLQLMEEEKILIVLVSSAINWVESSMVKCFGRNAVKINGFYKCRELSFGSICRIYPDYPKTDLFILYSILGGVPGLWNFMDLNRDVRANIEMNILSDRAYLRHAGYLYCMDGLRESGVYDTILASMAKGNTKLNDLYRTTGYSRAKISVYLKALMEQEQIEKVYSIECPGMENARKGIYEINSHFTAFWFTFIYPYEKELTMLPVNAFYDRFIKERLAAYCSGYIRKIVKEYMILTGVMPGERKAVPDRFAGKKQCIDVAWKTESGYAAVWCRKLKAMTTYEDYMALVSAAKEAGMAVSDYYMVSYRDFDEKLTLEARMKKNLHLLPLMDMLRVLK